MARNLQTKFAVTGEDQYKNAVKGINSELATLKSEMALTSSAFANNSNSIEALRAKNEVLTKQYEKQAEKVQTMREAHANAMKSQQEYGQKVEEAKSKVESAEKALDELKNSTGDTSQEQAKLNATLEQAKQQLAAAESGQQKAATAANEWGKKANYAEAELNKLDNEIQNNKQALNDAKDSAEKAGQKVEDFGDKAKGAGEKSSQMADDTSKGFQAIGSALVAAGVKQSLDEIVQALEDCYIHSVEFNKGMSETFTLLPGISTEFKNKIKSDLLELKTDMGIVGNDSTTALYQAVSAGEDAATATEFLATSQKAAVGGVTSLTTAVDGLTSVTNAYGKENVSTQQASDMMFTAVKLGKTNFEQLSSSLYNVVPIASSNKIAFEDITAAMAAMTVQGVPTAQSTTQMRQMLVELTDSGSAVAGTFEEISGVSFKNFIAQGGNTQEALQQLYEYAQQSSIGINELFSSVEAGSAAMALSGDNAQRYADDITAMKESAGATDAAYKEMSKTADFASKKFKASAETLKITIGSVLEPQMVKLNNLGTGTNEWAAEFVKENPWVVSAVEALGAAIGVLALAVTGFTVATNIVIPVIKSFNVALASNPIGLVLVAVASLSAALIALASAWPEATGAEADAKRAAEETTEALKSMKEETESNVEAAESNAEVAGKLVKRLKELEDQGLKTALAKQEYADVVAQLNTLMPELSLEIDEQTGLLKDGTQALTENVEAQKNKAKAKIYTEQYTSALEEQARAEVDAEKNQRKIKEAMDEVAEATERYEEVMQLLSDESIDYSTWQELTSEAYNLDNTIRTTNFDLLELNDAQKKYDETLQTTNEALNGAKESYDEYQSSMTGVTEMTPELQTAFGEVDLSIQNTAEEIGILSEEFYDAQQAAYESIDGILGLFNEMDIGTETSAKSMISSLDNQLTYLDDYSENMKAAIAAGVDEGLIQKLSDGSQESADILHGLANASGDEITAINEKFGKVEEGKDKFSSEIGKIKTDLDARLEEMQKKMDETVEKVDQYEEAAENAGNTVDGIVKGLRDGIARVEAAGEELGKAARRGYDKGQDSHSPSREMMKAAENSIQGILVTTSAAKQRVYSAFQDLGVEARIGYEEALDINSPSRVMMTSTEWAVKGILIPAEDAKQKVYNAFSKLGQSAKNGYGQKMKDLADEAYKVAQQMQSQLNTLNKTHEKNVSDIKKRNTTNLTQIKKDYEDTIESINRSIASRTTQLGSPDELFSGMKDADYFIEYMRQGTEELESFKAEYDTLMEKELPDALKAQLEELGTENLEDIKVLNQMTDEQLKEYVSLWEKRQSTANELAKKQYQDEKTDAKNQRDQEIAEEKERYKKELAAENARAEKEIAALKAKANKAMKEISNEIANGLKKGLLKADSSVVKAMQSMINNMVKAAKKELKINSPSGVAIEISEYFGEGLIVGNKNKEKDVRKSFEDITTVQAEQYAQQMTEAMEGYYRAIEKVRKIQSQSTNTVNNNQVYHTNPVIKNSFGETKATPASIARAQRKQMQEIIRKVKKQ